MKRRINLIACMFMLLFVVSCDNTQVLEQAAQKQKQNESLDQNAKKADSPIALNSIGDTPVKLSFAKSVLTSQGYLVSYKIRIKRFNSGPETVQVYFSRGGGPWTTVNASLISGYYSNYNVYGYSTLYSSSLPITFVIKYTVNGVTYWDNNDGQNYVLPSGTKKIVGNNVTLLWAESYYVYNSHGSSNKLRGEILVQDICPNKRVGVRYNIINRDNNWYDLDFTLASTSSDGTQVWSFDWPLVDVPPYAPLLGTGNRMWQFAVFFENKDTGTQYWENNFNMNYGIPFANTASPGVVRTE